MSSDSDNNHMLEKIFTKLGLGNQEAKAYLQLLEGGITTAGNLAKKMGVPRSSLYGFLSNLADKGLVTQSARDNVILWRAEQPETIAEILDRQSASLDQAKLDVRKLLPNLKAKQSTDLIAPRFKYFEGAEGVKHILRDMLLYHDLETEAFWPIRDMIDILGTDFFEYLNQRRIKQNLYTRAIWPRTKSVDIKRNIFLGVGKEFKREIREAPAGVTTSMGYWAYGNKVAFLSSQRESFGFIVESAELRQMMKTQFEMLWNLSKPIKVSPKDTKEFLKRHQLLSE